MAERKILIVTNRVPYPLKDGGNIAMYAMIEGYRRAGWEVYLLAMNTTKHYIQPEQLNNLFSDLHAFDWLDIDNDLKWKDMLRNYLFSNEPEHAVRFYSPLFKEKIIQVLGAFKPDVVQIESIYLTTYLPEIKGQSPAITVLRLHNIEYQIWQGLADKERNPIKKSYLENLTVRIRNFEREAWRSYDLLLAITDKDANLVNRLEMVKDMIVAPFSVEMEQIKADNHEKWVGYHIGAMDWMPNRDGMEWFLDSVWPEIHKAAPEFEFYFAGRKMPQEFKNLNLPGVHCLGEVADAEQFIADKKILIVPITSGGGIRVKILEAMAKGKVVITTTTGIKGIEARANEHFLLANKPEEFAIAVRWCLDHKAEAQKMADNAVRLVKEKYEYGSVIKKVIGELEILLSSPRTNPPLSQ